MQNPGMDFQKEKQESKLFYERTKTNRGVVNSHGSLKQICILPKVLGALMCPFLMIHRMVYDSIPKHSMYTTLGELEQRRIIFFIEEVRRKIFSKGKRQRIFTKKKCS